MGQRGPGTLPGFSIVASITRRSLLRRMHSVVKQQTPIVFLYAIREVEVKMPHVLVICDCLEEKFLMIAIVCGCKEAGISV
jgi:hypothetical protein